MAIERILLETVGARLEAALLAVHAIAQPLGVPHLLGRVGDENVQLVTRRDDRVAECGLKHIDPLHDGPVTPAIVKKHI